MVYKVANRNYIGICILIFDVFLIITPKTSFKAQWGEYDYDIPFLQDF